MKANNVINSVRGAVYRTETLNNLKQIGVALVGYEAARQRFPSSSTSTQPGQAGLSWRVAILPYLEEKSLYDQFKMNEPWDSEHNLKLVAQMPKVFRSPGSDAEEGYTNYLAVVGPNTVIANAGKGTRMQEITDGTSMTAMVIEVDDDHAVVWTQPADYEWEAGELAQDWGRSGRVPSSPPWPTAPVAASTCRPGLSCCVGCSRATAANGWSSTSSDGRADLLSTLYSLLSTLLRAVPLDLGKRVDVVKVESRRGQAHSPGQTRLLSTLLRAVSLGPGKRVDEVKVESRLGRTHSPGQTRLLSTFYSCVPCRWARGRE